MREAAFDGLKPVDPGVGAEEPTSMPREPADGGDVVLESTEVGARTRGASVAVDVGSPEELDATVGAGVAPEVGVEEEDIEQPQFALNWSVEDAT